MSTVYDWKPQGRRELPAQVAGERLEAIRLAHAGRLIPVDVVNDARPDDSPLHPVFEWDDQKAAEKWRVEEARHLIQNIVVINSNPKIEQKPIRAFVSVADNDGPNYTSIAHAMSEPELREQVIQQAWRELQGWHQRYKDYSEFATIFDAIEEAPIVKPEARQSEAADAVRSIARRFDSHQAA